MIEIEEEVTVHFLKPLIFGFQWFFLAITKNIGMITKLYSRALLALLSKLFFEYDGLTLVPML